MNVFELGEQQVAQRDAAGGAVPCDRIVVGDEIAVEGKGKGFTLSFYGQVFTRP
jgi:hypothetical protein